MYAKATGKDLDGVIAMDPLALQDMIGAVGSLNGDGVVTTVDESNAADVLLRDSYTQFPNPDKQNVFLASLVRQFWDKLNGTSTDGQKLVTGLVHAISTQHVKIYSDHPEEQSSFAGAGAAGDYNAYGPGVQMVFGNNYTTTTSCIAT